MSTYYYLCCDDCRKMIHISQGRGDRIYLSAGPLLGKFLKNHEGHNLTYVDEHQCKEPEQGFEIVKEEHNEQT